MVNQNKNIANEPHRDFEKAEMDLLREALKKSYTEKFKTMTTLMKMNIMFRQARISHRSAKKVD